MRFIQPQFKCYFSKAWDLIVGSSKKFKTLIDQLKLEDAVASDFDFLAALVRYRPFLLHSGRVVNISMTVGDADVEYPYFAASCLVPLVVAISMFQLPIPTNHDAQVKSYLDLKAAVQALQPAVEQCVDEGLTPFMPRITLLHKEASSMWVFL